MADDAAQYSITLAYPDAIPEELTGLLVHMVENTDLLSVMVLNILRNLPNPSTWRLTITGDLIASVNELEVRDTPYTLARGSGTVGARTLNQSDGTYDIIIPAEVLFYCDEDPGSPEAFIDHVLRVASHLALHESGHGMLHVRGEDSDAFGNLAEGTPTQLMWKKRLAAHIDDFRIERMTRATAPSPFSQEEGLESAIGHLREELNTAASIWRADTQEAAMRSNEALNSMVRSVTYIAAELGEPEGSAVPRPARLPEGWDRYLAATWDRWMCTFYALEPADKPMAPSDLAKVLSGLCSLATEWQTSIGYQTSMADDGSAFAYWTGAPY